MEPIRTGRWSSIGVVIIGMHRVPRPSQELTVFNPELCSLLRGMVEQGNREAGLPIGHGEAATELGCGVNMHEARLREIRAKRIEDLLIDYLAAKRDLDE